MPFFLSETVRKNEDVLDPTVRKILPVFMTGCSQLWFLRGPGTKLPSEVEALKSKPTQPLLIYFSMYQKLAVASRRFSWEIGHGCLDHALDRKVMFAYECHPIFAKSLSVQKFLLQPWL